MTPAARRVLWLLALAFVAHEAEEWNLVAWEQASFSPAPEIGERALHTLLALFAALGLGFSALALLVFPPRAALRALLPLFVVVIFGNALTHLFWLAYFRSYGPGMVTAALLLVPLTLRLVFLVHRDRLVVRGYLWALVALALLQPIGAAAAGSTLSGGQLALQRLGVSLGSWLWGAG